MLILKHIYVPIIVSTIVVIHQFYMYSTRFYLVLVFEVFYGYFRYFWSFRAKIARVRGLGTMVEDETRIRSHYQAFQVIRKGLVKSKIP